MKTTPFISSHEYPYSTRALLDGFAANEGRPNNKSSYRYVTQATKQKRLIDPNFDPLTIRYTYNLSTEVPYENRPYLAFAKVAAHSIQVIEAGFSFSPRDRTVNEASLQAWKSVAKIPIFESDHDSAHVFFLNAADHEHYYAFNMNHVADSNSLNYIGRSLYRPNYIAYNQKKFQEYSRDGLGARHLYLGGHEWGHVLEFEHGFEFVRNFRDVLLPIAEQNTWFSIMNYDDVIWDDNLPIIRINPSAYDIRAIQHIHPPQITQLEDDIYDLTVDPLFSSHCRTIETLYDSRRFNPLTLSAKGYKGYTRLDLRSGSTFFSMVGHRHVSIYDETIVNNAISGDGESAIYLNHENNDIDARHAKGPITIITSLQCGQDVMQGFNSSRGDKVQIEVPADESACISVSVKSTGEDTQLILNNKNMITLKNVSASKIEKEQVQFVRVNNFQQCSAAPEHSPIIFNPHGFFYQLYQQRKKTKQESDRKMCPVVRLPKINTQIEITHEFATQTTAYSKILSNCAGPNTSTTTYPQDQCPIMPTSAKEKSIVNKSQQLIAVTHREDIESFQTSDAVSKVSWLHYPLTLLDNCLDALTRFLGQTGMQLANDCPSFFPKHSPNYWKNGGLHKPLFFKSTDGETAMDSPSVSANESTPLLT